MFRGDIESDLLMLGSDMCNCPNLRCLELVGNSVLMDENYTKLLQETSASTTIETVIVRQCEISADTYDSVYALFCIENLKQMSFYSCHLSSDLLDLMADCECDWNSVHFVDCHFRSGVDADVITMMTTMRGLRRVEFINSGLSSVAMRMLLRDVRDRHNVEVFVEN